MPGLEQVSSPPSGSHSINKTTTMQDMTQEDNDDPAISYEPVLDPHPEPHVPAMKKMLDLTSMLGNVLGQVTEHAVDNVTAPTLTTQQQGFPQPMHRSLFKMKKDQAPKPTASIDDKQGSLDSMNEQHMDYQQENDQRIASMTEDEILAAREEILASLSHASIAYLNGQQKPSLESSQQQQPMEVDRDTTTVALEGKSCNSPSPGPHSLFIIRIRQIYSERRRR
jgi:hypothetical protein